MASLVLSVINDSRDCHKQFCNCGKVKGNLGFIADSFICLHQPTDRAVGRLLPRDCLQLVTCWVSL